MAEEHLVSTNDGALSGHDASKAVSTPPGSFGVSPERLQSLAVEVRQGAAAIELLLSELERKVRPLASDWQGSASDSFNALWSQWQTGATHVHQALVAISELLGKAGNAYAEAERSIAAAFQV